MIRINKIYTRGGDQGETSLIGGRRVSKGSLRVEAYGEIDELTAKLGLVQHLSQAQNLIQISEKVALVENELFDLGSGLACAADLESPLKSCITPEHISRLEAWIDALVSGLPELKSFVLPGGSQLNAEIHSARCICRRAERRIVRLAQSEPVSAEVLAYVNRLSDLLFAMARYEAKAMKREEVLWKPMGAALASPKAE